MNKTYLLEFGHVFKRDRFSAVTLALHIIGAEPPLTLDVNFCTKRSAQQEVVQCKIEVAVVQCKIEVAVVQCKIEEEVKGEVDRGWQ